LLLLLRKNRLRNYRAEAKKNFEINLSKEILSAHGIMIIDRIFSVFFSYAYTGSVCNLNTRFHEIATSSFRARQDPDGASATPHCY
jgi:hypothetical protein